METVLIVDDEPEILRVQKYGLQSQGYDVITAEDADTALVKLAALDTSIDMIITDNTMPGMSGLDLLKRLRKNGVAIPVILMTAFGQKKLVIDALKNQCDGFIEKPFSMDQLLEEIRRAKQARLPQKKEADFRRLFPRLLHQINNPLMAISGHAETSLFQPDIPDDLKTRFESIVRAVGQIKALNHEIMQMGSARSNHKTVIDLVDIIEESLHLFEGATNRDSIDIQTLSNETRIPVLGNRQALHHVFNNLIQNAIQAVSDRKIRRIRVTHTVINNGATVRIHVKDTGCGIVETDLATIFDPYFTLKKQGTGLGLVIAREIIDSHDGNISVISRVNIGTCFTIDLPSAICQPNKYTKGENHGSGE